MNKTLSVLIVDDDIRLGDSLTDILETTGHDIKFVSSGKDALSTIKKSEYDIILMDIRMPGMNGVETLRHIKEQSPNTSVVMMTAFAEDELVSQAREEGALQILSKPLDIDKILGFIKKHELLHTIFIVDDDYTFCDSLKDAIEINNYEATHVHSAQEAIDTFENQTYGIVLLDIKLNGKNGVEVAEAIKDKGYKCAIVLMSAYKKEFQPLLDKIDKNINFIGKPFKIDDIIKLLNKVSNERLKEMLA